MTDTTGIHNYTYDELSRLIQATHPVIPTENFSYDPVGNRLGTTVNAANRLLEDANYTYTYDNNGNLTTKTRKTDPNDVTTFTYDYENRLIQVTSPTTTSSYKYDPMGRRIEKNVNGTITKYLYDTEDIIAEYDDTGAITTTYTHGPGIDEPLSMEKNNQSYYYHADGPGSITAVTDTTGDATQKYEYDSYGNITYQLDPNFMQPYTYTGREYDPETGMYYYRNRTYNPQTGTFISEDPIGFAGGTVNLYTYVNSNPLNRIDPFGLLDTSDGVTLKVTNSSSYTELAGKIMAAVGGALLLGVPSVPVKVVGAGLMIVGGGLIVYDYKHTMDKTFKDVEENKNEIQKKTDELEKLNKKLDNGPCPKEDRK